MCTIKNIVSCAYKAYVGSQNITKNGACSRAPMLKGATTRARHQRGVTLLELMVGITIGLLVVAVAMGALMVSRGISGTVSDASMVQQQAAYAMRVIGTQLRQAGSLRVNLNYDTSAVAEPYQAKVAIETAAPATSGNAFDPSNDTIKGTATSMTVGYRRYTELLHNKAAEESQSRNCLGAPADTSTDQLLESIFTFNAAKNDLRCSGNSANEQPIVGNVANFQVRYLLQDNSAGGDSKINNVDAAGVGGNWARVQGIEVCLVLYGNEPMDLPSGSNYTDCDGSTQDMSAQTGNRARRMHMVFRNVFQLRSQGLM